MWVHKSVRKFLAPAAVVIIVLGFLFGFLIPQLSDRGSMAYIVVLVPAIALVAAIGFVLLRGTDSNAE